MSRSLRVVVAIGALAAGGRAAAAPPEDQEEALIRHGVELRRAQDDLAARAEFQKAYDLTHSPRAAAQLGLAEFALGRWDEAEAHVSEGLRTPGDPFIRKHRVELDQSLATIKSHVARIEVIGEPAGADVFVNGRLAGQLPLATPVPVSEGQVDIELRARGFSRSTRTVTVTGGQYQRLVMRLEPEGRAPVTPSGAANQPAGSVVSTRAGPPAVFEINTSEGRPETQTSAASTDDVGWWPSTGRRVAKWAALGVAGAALVTGISATVIHESRLSTFERLHDRGCFDNNGRAVDSMGNAVAECQPSLDAALSARTWQIVGFTSAAVFAATWLVLELTEPSAAAAGTKPSVAWMCAPAVATGGATCVLRF